MKKSIMTKEERFKLRIDTIHCILENTKDDGGRPFFSINWLIDNILTSDEDKEKARRDIIYEKRKHITNKILNKDNV